MPLNVTGTALQLQSTEACTLFYTLFFLFFYFILLYVSFVVLSNFFFYRYACKLDNRLPAEQETQCLRGETWQFSPPFRFLEMECLVTSQTTHPLPLKNITVYWLLSQDTLLFRSAICRKMLHRESNNQSLPGLGRT